MAGGAKTKNFMLSAATVMIGPQADLHKLNPVDNSVGLVKNFQMTSDATYVDLTQGIRNSLVMSVKSGDTVRASFEVYEYSMRNLAYAAGLDASGVAFNTDDTIWLTTAAISTNNTIVVGSDVTSTIAVGDYIFLQNGIDDIVHIAKVASRTYSAPNTTIVFATGFETKAGAVFPIGSRVGEVKRIDLGNTQAAVEMSAKIIGLLPKDNAPFTILIPRMKVTRGLGVAFQTDNFGNLPFEITPFNQTPTDPFYNEYGDAVAVLFAR